MDGQEQEMQPTMVEGRTMAVLYGSEAGTAEDIAVEVGNMAERLRFQTTVDEMDGFKLSDILRASLVIFVVSTTGQGDMPKNTLKFWKNLRREKLSNTNCLGSLRFAIFGLGDSSYLKFNWAARKLRARLLQLGATEFFRPGEGDERHDNGIDSIYLPWHEELKATLITDYPLPESMDPIPDDQQLPCKYPIRLFQRDAMGAPEGNALSPEQERKYQASITKSAARSHVDHPLSAAEHSREKSRRLGVTFPADFARRDEVWEQSTGLRIDSLDKDNILKDHPEKYLLEPQPTQPAEGVVETPPTDLLPLPDVLLATVVRNDRVTPKDHWQDVRHLAFHVELEPKDHALMCNYAGEYTLTIWPKNYPADVRELISMMGWERLADSRLRIKQRPRELYFDEDRVTLRYLLTHNLDITAVPKRSFIRELIFFTQDEREKERLAEFTKPGNEQEFYDYTCRPRRTIIELLRDFPGVKIPLVRVLSLFPLIRGRDFSVCNAGESMKAPVRGQPILAPEILAALVEYKTIIRKPRQGLCSRYLKHLAVGMRVYIRMIPSSGPHLVANPIVANRPMIAIATGTGIAPIRALLQERRWFHTEAETLLFFGCRNRTADFHFSDEWQDYPNLRVLPAFSRDGIEPPGPQWAAGGALTTTTPTTTTPNSNSSSNPTGPLSPGAQRINLNPSILHHPTTLPPVTALAGPLAVEYDAHKNYVQHLIRAHAAEVGALLRRCPVVCVCGNAGKMPVSVRNALLDVLVSEGIVPKEGEGGGGREAAERWFMDPGNLTFWQEAW